MKTKILYAMLALLGGLLLIQATLDGKVDTRIGKLDFVNGSPSDATVEKLYDEMDFQRACQAYMWALPIVSFTHWHHIHQATFGTGNYDYVTHLSVEDKLGILDMWQRPMVDTGQIGPFKGKGGKYLVLGPDDAETELDGYHVLRSAHNNIFVAYRIIEPRPQVAKEIISKLRMYPRVWT